MTVQQFTDKLASLCDYLDSLTGRAPIDQLHRELTALDVKFEDMSGCARFSDDTYVRNLLREGSWYHLLVLCWRSGQRSPIHNHAGSTCGFRILKGVATETLFGRSPSTLVYPARTRDMQEGDTAVTQDDGVHQMSNLQAPGEDLVTLHVYSPPLLRMDTYSLTDPAVGEFRPVFFEHDFGSGI